jgi:Ca2+-binding EF-hand superfamily protein
MTRWTTILLALGLSGSIALSADEKGDKGKGKAEGKGNPEAFFKQRDKDGDGKLTLDEWKAGMPEDKAAKAGDFFKRLDKDGDGKLTLDEWKSGMEAAKKKGKGKDGDK